MADISKLPGVTHTWPSKPLKTVFKKNKKNKRDNDKKNKNSDKNADDTGTEHIDEYA